MVAERIALIRSFLGFCRMGGLFANGISTVIQAGNGIHSLTVHASGTTSSTSNGCGGRCRFPPLLGVTSPTPDASHRSQAVGDQIVKGALAQLVVAGGMRAAVQCGSQLSRTHGLLASSPVCGHPVRPGHGHAPYMIRIIRITD